jgi:hypothetical protein
MFKNTGCFSKGESTSKEPVMEAKVDELRSPVVLSPIISTSFFQILMTDVFVAKIIFTEEATFHLLA